MIRGAGRLDDPRLTCVRHFMRRSPHDVVLVGAARAPDDVVFRGRAPDNVGAFALRAAGGPPDSIRTIIATACGAPDDVVFRAGTPDDVITRLVRASGAPDDVVFLGRRTFYRRRAVVSSRTDAAPDNGVPLAGARGPPRDVEAPRVGVRPKHAAADAMAAPVDVPVPRRRIAHAAWRWQGGVRGKHFRDLHRAARIQKSGALRQIVVARLVFGGVLED